MTIFWTESDIRTHRRTDVLVANAVRSAGVVRSCVVC